MRKAHKKADQSTNSHYIKSSQSYIITNRVFIHKSKDDSEFKQQK
jgi:hypothetical protein